MSHDMRLISQVAKGWICDKKKVGKVPGGHPEV